MSLVGRTAWLVALAALVSTGVVFGQSVVPAQAGVINYTEGDVFVDGVAVKVVASVFPRVKAGGELRTKQGRAEVLLNPGALPMIDRDFIPAYYAASSPVLKPGAVLWLGEDSSVRMLSTKLADTRVEMLSGSMLLECADLPKGTSVVVGFRGATIQLRKTGLYRLDAEPPTVSVYRGEVGVESDAQHATLNSGKRLLLNSVWQSEKFDANETDMLYRWSARRAGYMAKANIAAAKYVMDSDSRRSFSYGGWFLNPWMNMYTYLPCRGYYYSPFGYRYYSPQTVYVVYNPQPQSGGGRDWRTGWTPSQLGYSTMHQTSAGTSGVIASSPSVATSSPVSSAPPASSVSRDSGRAGGTGR
jgi:hypothetical protein